jgi:hypothetical protein
MPCWAVGRIFRIVVDRAFEQPHAPAQPPRGDALRRTTEAPEATSDPLRGLGRSEVDLGQYRPCARAEISPTALGQH